MRPEDVPADMLRIALHAFNPANDRDRRAGIRAAIAAIWPLIHAAALDEAEQAVADTIAAEIARAISPTAAGEMALSGARIAAAILALKEKTT